MYDYLVVGAGLYGTVFAREAKAKGKSLLVIEKRSHAAGNIYTEKKDILGSNGAELALNCHHLLLRGCQYVLLMIIIILMQSIKVYQWVVILR